MKKLHVKRDGQWMPVFCYRGSEVVTCAGALHKALPTVAAFGPSDLAFFARKFSDQQFALFDPAKGQP